MRYLSSGPIVVMILEGENAVASYRKVMGATNPKDAEDNTIKAFWNLLKKFSTAQTRCGKTQEIDFFKD